MQIGIIETGQPLSLEEAAAVLSEHFHDVEGCFQDECLAESPAVAYLWNTVEWEDAVSQIGLVPGVHAVYGDDALFGEIWNMLGAAIDEDGRLYAASAYGMPYEPESIEMFAVYPDNIYILFAYEEH